MGLAERRATHEYQTHVFPDLKRQIDDAAGMEVPVEIDWDSLAEPNEVRLYDEYWTKIYFEPLIDALRTICADDMGKQAVKEGLKKVQIMNSREKYGRSAYTFENGVLNVDHKLTNVDDKALRTETIVARLEEKL